MPQGTRNARGKPIVNLVPLDRQREDHGDPAGQGVLGGPLRVHGDGDGHGEEDVALRLLAAAPVGHHRRRPRRRRSPDRRRADRRQARRDAVQLGRQGGALRRERRAADGPQRARRARHDARQGPERDLDARRRGRDAIGAHGHRERLRQAHADRRVHAPRPRHEGHDRDPAIEPQRHRSSPRRSCAPTTR